MNLIKNVQEIITSKRKNISKKKITKEPLKNIAMILFFVLLFPYACAFMFGEVDPPTLMQEVSRERIIEADQSTVSVETIIGIEQIPIEDYLIGALAATMPIEYHLEALKAQGIILRTNLGNGQQDEYLSIPQLEEKWKEDFQGNYDKLKEAISTTNNLTLSYEGTSLVLPYFAISTGMTRSGEEVFQSKDYPYLLPVDSQNDIFSEEYISEILIDKKKILEELEIFFEDESNETSDFITIIKRDEAGYVVQLKIGEVAILGETVKQALHLPSSAFEVVDRGEEYLFVTEGLGHGLGMSQCGANDMAEGGSDCLAILNYYYSNIEIEKR